MTDRPAGHQRHKRYHAQQHKRDIVTNIVTVIETQPAAIVVVNHNGEVMYTSHASTEAASVQAAATASPEEPQNAVASAYSFPSFPEPESETTSTPPPPPPPPPATTTPSTTAKPAATSPAPSKPDSYSSTDDDDSSSGSSGAMSGYGIAYSPYNSDGTCRPAADVAADFRKLRHFGYVRSYGVDCDQVPSMMAAAKANGMGIMLGVFDLANADAELDTMIEAVGQNGGWAMVVAVGIGNEDANKGAADVGTIVGATRSARTKLRAAGYDGPVVHVDTFNQILDNPALCEASDFVAANCHAFFDPNTAASDAGAFVAKKAQELGRACGGKEVRITETGWPTGGSANGLAVPGAASQQRAMTSLKEKFSGNVVFFSAFNGLWKQNNAGTHGAEQYWGMFDSGSQLKGF